MKDNNTKKVVVITGASSGIGLATARLLTQKGYTVYGLSRRVTDAEFKQLSCDITDIEQIKKCFETIYNTENQIDWLINNAGMGVSGAVEHIPAEKDKNLFDVNLMGAFNVTKVAIPYLRKSSDARILNISSVAGVIPIPFQTSYSASKAGINSFTMALRLELQPDIKVCAVMPGDTRTGFTANRVKIDKSDGYDNRISASVTKMENDEKKGASPEKVAGTILKMLKKRKPKALVAVGFGYKTICLLQKILPQSLMLFIVKKIYAK